MLVKVKGDGSGFRLTAEQLKWIRSQAGEFIELRKPQRTRTLDQNAYWHAEVFPKIADYMGDDIEGAKLVLMGECWGWHKDKVTGRDVPVKPHTSSMTVEEGRYFTDWVIPWAVEHCDGLQIMLPGEWTAAHGD